MRFERIGGYQVTAKIGEGGMGEVYRARDTKLDRDVALKVLPQAFTDDLDQLARFGRYLGSPVAASSASAFSRARAPARIPCMPMLPSWHANS